MNQTGNKKVERVLKKRTKNGKVSNINAKRQLIVIFVDFLWIKMADNHNSE